MDGWMDVRMDEWIDGCMCVRTLRQLQRDGKAPIKARSHIETQLNSKVELSWVSVSFNM